MSLYCLFTQPPTITIPWVTLWLSTARFAPTPCSDVPSSPAHSSRQSITPPCHRARPGTEEVPTHSFYPRGHSFEPSSQPERSPEKMHGQRLKHRAGSLKTVIYRPVLGECHEFCSSAMYFCRNR